jgi:hypothetical protein
MEADVVHDRLLTLEGNVTAPTVIITEITGVMATEIGKDARFSLTTDAWISPNELRGGPAMADAIMVDLVKDPADYETRLEVPAISYAFKMTAILKNHLRTPWAQALLEMANVMPRLRSRVLVVTTDGRVAVTRSPSIASFWDGIDNPDFMHGNHSLLVNVRRIDRVVRVEDSLVYFRRGPDHPEDREVLVLSREGAKEIFAVLDGALERHPPVSCGPDLDSTT